MKCRKCGEEAVIIVPIEIIIEDYRDTQDHKGLKIKTGFFKKMALRLRGETMKETTVYGGPVTTIYGHKVKHYEGRCEQCWKAERMTDGPP